MARVAITEQYLEDIADAIRSKTGMSSTTYYPSEMADAIMSISGSGGITPTGTISITENGTYNVTSYASASVSVPTGSTINNQNKTVNPTTSQQSITYDSGYTGLGTVTVNAMPTMTLPTSAAVSATSGYTSKATIGRSTSDQYINIPTGYNSAGGYYKISAVANGSATGPTSLSGSSATVTTGTNTITLTKTGVTTTPTVSAGYVASATASTATVALTASVTTKAAATITPGTTNQTIASGTYLTGTQTIAGSSNLVASNIKKNVTIFGVTGTYEAGGSSPTIQSLSVTPSESEQTFNSSSVDGYKPVTVSAISSTYVGSGIPRKSNADSVLDGPEVIFPAGYYASVHSDIVQGGLEGTPTATKGTVSNHSISVTPSVTNEEGWIQGGTKTGTAVSVSASELVSGSETKTENGTYDVTNLASLIVAVQKGADIPIFSVDARQSTPTVTCNKTFLECYNLYNSNSTAAAIAEVTTQSATLKMAMSVLAAYTGSYVHYAIYNELGEPVADILYYANDTGTYTTPTALLGDAGTPTATKGAVSNHSVSVTPSVENTKGYITGGTKTGTAVSVSASELVSGTYSVTSSGTKDVTNYASASVPAGSVTAPSNISGTTATVSTGTNTLTLTKTVSVTPVVSAGYISSGTATNSSVSLTASVTTKAAATITPTTTNQTIASGTYLTGTQTIAGDADLVASNIVSGVQIFGVTGNVVLQNYYTGSSAPSSSTGSNGDLYLQS